MARGNPAKRLAFKFGTHEEVVVDVVKGTFDIELDHPVVFPTPLSRDGHCLLGRFARPITI
jgi:hypothetical protein